MNNENAKKLCMDLLRADTEAEVIQILETAGLWSNANNWRLYGDRDGNFSTIGSQQSRPESALVEKIVNSVDARLMNECITAGISPESEAAPQSIKEAVARFIEKHAPNGDLGGSIQSWTKTQQREQSEFITLAATGSRSLPSLTIADCGEGQSPKRMHETFLSIERSNKLRIRFVQGKFNMGGTGALRFCGKNSIQLIISRRNPAILKTMKRTSDDDKWSFTVVRRNRPSGEIGAVRNSVYRYLAPVDADSQPNRGELLTFHSDTLPLMPDGNNAYVRQIAFGSCIKLFEYDMKGFKSNVLMGTGLLSRLEVLLPEIALPVRVHECRDFRGHAGSYENTLVGLTARLKDNRGGNLEDGYPTSAPFNVHGHQMVATIYAFKGDKGDSYRTNEGIIFTINGQTHGSIPKTFFSRSAVKMGRLAKALLVVVDCSKMSPDAREDLFMNSRDRLSNHELRKALEESLEDLISRHHGLRELRERRRMEEIAERLEDSKPLEDVLKSLLKSSPTLARLFLMGQRLTRTHTVGGTGSKEGGGGGADDQKPEFVGKQHPSYFRFFKHEYGQTVKRNAEVGRRCRIKFETDVENEYFSRNNYRGRYNIEVLTGSVEGADLDNTLTLHNGIANWSISIPEDDVKIGDELTIQFTVSDDTMVEPFVSIAKIRFTPKSETKGGKNGERDSKGGDDNEGNGGNGAAGSGGKTGTEGQTTITGIQLPTIIEVKEGDERWVEHGFDEATACKIVEDATGNDDDDESMFAFYINVDNLALKAELKDSREDVVLQKSKFIYGNVLIGMAILHDSRNRPVKKLSESDDAAELPSEGVEAIVDRTTRAIAPFLIPMIDYLGALTPEEAAGIGQVGDESD